MIKICVAGATGRMGRSVLKEATTKGFQIVGAVEIEGNPNIGKSLNEAGICNSETRIVIPSSIGEAVKNADVYISFTTPRAEVVNIPLVADLRKRIVLGTTGLTDEQMRKVKSYVSAKVPSVISHNFAIGVNMMFQITKSFRHLPP